MTDGLTGPGGCSYTSKEAVSVRKLNHRRERSRPKQAEPVVRPRCSGARQPVTPAFGAEPAGPAPRVVPLAIIRISSVIIIVVGVPGPG